MTSDLTTCLPELIALAAGVTVIVALAALAERLIEGAVWQRTAWRAAIVAMGVVTLFELTGVTGGLVQLASSQGERTTAQDIKLPEKRQPPTADNLESMGTRAAVSAINETARDENDFAIAERTAPIGRSFDLGDLATVGYDAQSPELNLPPNVAKNAPQIFGGEARASDATESTTPADDVPSPNEWHVATSPISISTNGPQPVQFAWIWAAGFAALACRFLFVRILLVRLVRRRTRPIANAELAKQTSELARAMQTRRRVRLLQTDLPTTPIAFGIWRPTIILPATFADDFTLAEQQAILAHELGHLAARDPLWQAVADLLSAALWWHPLIWLARRRLLATSESAADEASLFTPAGPEALATCLVQLARRFADVRQRPSAGLAVAGEGFRSGLGRRVERLMRLSDQNKQTGVASSTRRPKFLKLLGVCAPVALVLASISCTAWGRPQANIRQGDSTMALFQDSWRRSLAAATLAPLLVLAPSDSAAQDDTEVDSPEEVVELQQQREEHVEVEETRFRPTENVARFEQPERELDESQQHELDELTEAAERLHSELRELGDPEGRHARTIRQRLREIHKAHEHLVNELPHGPLTAHLAERLFAAEEDLSRGRFESARRQLEQEAARLERRLRQAPENRQAHDIRAALHKIHEKMHELHQQQHANHEHWSPEAALQDHHRVIEEHRRHLEIELRRIHEELARARGENDENLELVERLMAAAEKVQAAIAQLNAQVDVQMQEAIQHEQIARQVRRQAEQHARSEAENIFFQAVTELDEAQPPGPNDWVGWGNGADAPPRLQRELAALQGEVGQLRGQVRDMHEQLSDMRRLLETLVQRDRRNSPQSREELLKKLNDPFAE